MGRAISGCFFYLLSMAVWAVSIFLLSQCTSSTQKALIKNAREQDKIEAYSRYLDKYPRGRFAEESKEAILYLVYLADDKSVDELLERKFVDNTFRANINSICDYKNGEEISPELKNIIYEQSKQSLHRKLKYSPEEETWIDTVVMIISGIVNLILGLLFLIISAIPVVLVWALFDNYDELWEKIKKYFKTYKERKVAKKYEAYPNAYRAIINSQNKIEYISDKLCQYASATKKHYNELMSKPDSWLAYFEWELVDEFKINVEHPYQELKRQYPEGLKEWRKKCVGDQTYWRNILRHKEEIIELDKRIREEV